MRPSRAASGSPPIQTRTLLGAIAIVGAAFWIYGPALRGSWLWDDGLEIAHNPLLPDPAGWWKPWVHGSGMDYFPFKSTLQWLQWRGWGSAVLGYHATNVALHALCALLLWRLLARLGVRAAWFGGLIFAVHPVAVESVAWISEFKNELSLAFLLLACLAYLPCDGILTGRTGRPGSMISEPFLQEDRKDREGRHSGALSNPDPATETTAPQLLPDLPVNKTTAQQQLRDLCDLPVKKNNSPTAASPSSWKKGYVISLLLFVLAMLGKSSVVMFPAVILLHAWWKRGRVGRRDWLASAPFFAVSLVLGAATLWFQSHRAIVVAGTTPFGARLAQAGWSVWLYLWNGLAPFRLAPVYGTASPGLPGFLPWIAIVAAALALVVPRGGRFAGARRALALGLGWFFLNLLPVLGLVPIAYLRVAPRADHLCYVSLAGIAGLAAAGAGALLARLSATAGRPAPGGARIGLMAALAAAAAILATQSRTYASNFRSDESLWTYGVRRNPSAWVARNNLGKVYLEAGRPADAEAQFRKAIRLQPDSAETHANLGNALENLGDTEEARAQYADSIRLDPEFAGARYDLGLWYLLAGRPAEAADEFRSALRLDPLRATVHNNLGLALFRLGRRQEAVAEYRQALSLSPDLPEAHVNLGNALYQDNRLAEAADQYRQALRADPDYAAAHHDLGYALEGLGRYDEAKAELDEAERLQGRQPAGPGQAPGMSSP